MTLASRLADLAAYQLAAPTAPDLARWTAPGLNADTVHEVLGRHSDPHDVACLRLDVLTAVEAVEQGIEQGHLPACRLIRGRPLADWLVIDEVARLTRMMVR